MLDGFDILPALPAADLDRAKRFYSERLGMTPDSESGGGVYYRSGSARFYLFPTEEAGTAGHTVAAWEVDHIEPVVEKLRAQGVVFEEYDRPGLKTVNGIADFGGERVAWFRDSEGNTLCIVEPNGRTR